MQAARLPLPSNPFNDASKDVHTPEPKTKRIAAIQSEARALLQLAEGGCLGECG